MSSEWEVPAEYRGRLHPTTVIDVGVSTGTQALYSAFPDAYYMLVEPLEENVVYLECILETLRGEYVLAAAGAKAGTAILNIEPNRRGMSSILERTGITATADGLIEREVPVMRVDDIVKEHTLTGPFGLKIDTEGYELEVLRGADETLASCAFVITETSTSERFQGSYRSHELIEELRHHDLVVYDVMGSTRNYVDLLFMKK